ncbi:MAG: anaerobic glycerol-3-phosphate dehydrogenase subunit C [Chloroflexota bacterium]|nr:anaerobic glycerol-3-phosphate dehydrogenase subunit C [Chloroflexota bacterium]
MTAPTEIRALEASLKRNVSGEVRFDSYSRAMYSTDASIYQMMPIGVVIPKDDSEVASVISTCAEAGIPILSRGGGTSLAGQTVNYAVVIDYTKYMHNPLEVNAEERWVRTQPGITLDELNHYLRPYDLYYTPDPTTSSRATIGGTIGNNSCGAHSVVYGKTVDHVLELNAILSNGQQVHFQSLPGAALETKFAQNDLEGSIYRDAFRIARENAAELDKRYPTIPRRVSGYNLDALLPTPKGYRGSRKLPSNEHNMASLIVGSEGTMVAVTEAKLNLEPLPKVRGLAILHFNSLVEAMEANIATLPHHPSAVELIDDMVIQRSRESVGFARRLTWVEGNPKAMLLVEFFADSSHELESKIQGLREDMQSKRLSYACVVALTPEAQGNAWAIRAGGLGLLMSVKGDTKPLPFVEDTAIAPEQLPQFVKRFDEVVREHDTVAGYYGHASEGCIHIRPMVNIKTQAGLDKLVSIATDISDLVSEFGGVMSGEHGDGIVRGVFTEKMFGSQLYNAFRNVKKSFDPQGIMNPGKIVDCPPITENLRLGPNYQAWEPPTTLSFVADGGFTRAVELCNGVGECRKHIRGVMCPSYMATREEEHSTRGRANALRSVLSGVLPPDDFASKRLYEVMDLCLECKGCKVECPSGVDMAKIKYEFLANYYRQHKVPIRSHMVANIAKINAVTKHFGSLGRVVLRSALTRWLLHFFVGFDRRRQLPAIAPQTFSEWFYARHNTAEDDPLLTSRQRMDEKRQVVLFHDTFIDYNEPQVGIATVELLEAAGYDVLLADKVCCGRPMISKGLLDKAKANAQINVDRLHWYTKQGIPIVGCEPSCLLTLRDEYPDMLGTQEANDVAANTYMIDEFLSKLHSEGILNLKFKEMPGKALFHGHCHQKALVGTAASLATLRLVPGLEVEEIQSGCCGMAGSFGYEREHYDISMSIGEQRLFPAVRSQEKSTVVIMGTSCRHQIEDGTGYQPMHLVEILRSALVS